MADDFHYHLHWAGHEVCRDPDCTRPRDDPSLDMACPEPGTCDGTCEAVRHNAGRRAHLPVPDWPIGYTRLLERLEGMRERAQR